MTHRATVGAGVADVDLSDRTVLVTGSTSGVGRETALALGRLGARVFVHGRNREAGATVVAALRAAGTDAEAFYADFASLDAVEMLADEVRAATDELHVLVNNAGAHFRTGRLTGAGVERTIAVNHLAPFSLTNHLLPMVPEDGRIVTVASEAHRGATLDLAAFESVVDYDGLASYQRSKLANVLFTRELARRTDVPANCCHPGFVPESALWREASWPVKLATGALSRLPSALTGGRIASSASAAETSVYLAASPAAARTTGEYFVDCEPARPAPAARDDDAARRLWTWSADVTGVG